MNSRKFTKITIFMILMMALLVACGPSENTTVPETQAAAAIPTEAVPEQPATINGTIAYQANTHDSTLYAVNVEDHTQSFTLPVPGSFPGPNPMEPAPFSMEVDPGSYYLFAYSPNGNMASAYAGRAEDSLYTLTLSSGEVMNEVALNLVYPQYPCQITPLPASPDGLYPAIEVNSSCMEEFTASDPNNGTVNGQVSFQAPPTPATYIYFLDVNTGYWTSTISEIATQGAGTFSTDVPPGEYKVWAFSVDGSQAAAIRDFESDELGTISVVKGETIAITLINSAPTNPCQSIAIPAAPNGSFPAIEVDTECIKSIEGQENSEDTTPGIFSGTIAYQGPPTPTSILYIVNPYSGQWYWVEILGGSSTISFSRTVDPGTYVLYAHQSDGVGTQAAAFTNADGSIAEMILRAGQTLDGISLTFAYPTSPCQRTAIPASPDGRFPAIAPTC